MSVPFYAKSETNKGYIKNLEVVGFSDLNGINAFQMALYKTGDKYYMYCGSFKGAGVNIVDVTDPAKPEVVGIVYVSDPNVYFAQSTPKVQVADDKLIVALGGGVPFLHGIKPGDPADDGLQIYDLKKDPLHPELLSHWHTGLPNGMGVHRFAYNGGRYVYMPAECPGFVGFIVRILDISDPCNSRCGWIDDPYISKNETESGDELEDITDELLGPEETDDGYGYEEPED